MPDPKQEEKILTVGWSAFLRPEASRLEAALRNERFKLEAARDEIARMGAMEGGGAKCTEAPEAVGKIESLLAKAELALKKLNLDLSWRCLKLARRARVFLLDRAALEAWATELLHEAEDRIGGRWRKETIRGLLRPIVPGIAEDGDGNSPKTASGKSDPTEAPAGEGGVAGGGPKKKQKGKKQKAKVSFSPLPLREVAVRVHRALELRDAYFDQFYYTNSILRRYQVIILSALVIFVIAIIGLGAAGVFPFTESAQAKGGWKILLASAVFGLLGSSFSSIRALVTEFRKLSGEELSKEGLQVKTLFIRLFIGASAGLVAYILLASGILFPGSQSPANTPVEYYDFFAFASGFSDAIIVRGVDMMAKKGGKAGESAEADQGD